MAATVDTLLAEEGSLHMPATLGAFIPLWTLLIDSPTIVLHFTFLHAVSGKISTDTPRSLSY